jgi:hypothetical protein
VRDRDGHDEGHDEGCDEGRDEGRHEGRGLGGRDEGRDEGRDSRRRGETACSRYFRGVMHAYVHTHELARTHIHGYM